MAVTSYSFRNFTGDGATSQFTFQFPFLNRAHIVVVVNGVIKTLNTDYTVNVTTSRVDFMTPPASGAAISVYRKTPRADTERVVVFRDPSNLRAEDLNNADLQQLFITQELIDRVGASVRSEPADGTPSDLLASLPPIAARAEKIFGFDLAGQPAVSPVTLTQLQLIAERNAVGLLPDVSDYGIISDSVVLVTTDYGLIA